MAVKDRTVATEGPTSGDFRTNPMPSPEGHGAARKRFKRAWDAYTKVLDPVVQPAAVVIGRSMTFDLMGFWLSWNLHGGFEGMQRDFKMSRSAVYRRVSAFRHATGQHPDDFKLPGVTFKVDQYLYGGRLIAPVQQSGTVDE